MKSTLVSIKIKFYLHTRRATLSIPKSETNKAHNLATVSHHLAHLVANRIIPIKESYYQDK